MDERAAFVADKPSFKVDMVAPMVEEMLLLL
jgi:hypothetical protein